MTHMHSDDTIRGAIREATTKTSYELARISVFKNHSFFASKLVSLEVVFTTKYPTMATDNKNFYINREWANTFTYEELVAVICHECMHCLLGHHAMAVGKDFDIFNRATDYVINDILVNSGLTLPRGCLLDSKYSNMTCEAVYRALLAESRKSIPDKPGQPGQPGQTETGQTETGQPNDGDNTYPNSTIWDLPTGAILPAENLTSQEIQQELANCRNELSRAISGAGSLPKSMTDKIFAEIEPKTDWRSTIAQYMQESCPDDYSWTRRNRRYLQSNVIMPKLYNPAMRLLVIIADTSGSIGADTIKLFVSNIAELNRVASPKEILVIYCDDKVQSTETFGPYDTIELNVPKGGGTDFRPPFDYINNQGIIPSVIIYFTDLYGREPKTVDYPTIWACINTKVASTGITVQVDDLGE